MSSPGKLVANWVMTVTRFADGQLTNLNVHQVPFDNTLISPFTKSYLQDQGFEKIYEYVCLKDEAPDARYVIAKEKLQEAWAKVQAKG